MDMNIALSAFACLVYFLCKIYEKRPFGREWVGWLRLRFVLMKYGRGRGRESSVPGYLVYSL